MGTLEIVRVGVDVVDPHEVRRQVALGDEETHEEHQQRRDCWGKLYVSDDCEVFFPRGKKITRKGEENRTIWATIALGANTAIA